MTSAEARKLDILLALKKNGYNLVDGGKPEIMTMSLGGGYTLECNVKNPTAKWRIIFNDGIETTEYPADSEKVIHTHRGDADKLIKEYNDELRALFEDGVRAVDEPDTSTKEESPRYEVGAEQWTKPPAKNVFNNQNIEPVTLPAPVGVGGIVRPAVSAAEALAAWKEFQELKNLIIDHSDLQKIQGKNFIKKSGWRKFATFYNLTDNIVEENQIPLEKGGFYWKIKVVCTAPNGRQTEGVGMCASSEKSGARQLHDIYTTAHTRAKNRAISDMIAAGEVSAEEMGA